MYQSLQSVPLAISGGIECGVMSCPKDSSQVPVCHDVASET